MTDTYTQIVNNPIGGFIAKNVGLPQPTPLARWEPGAPVIDGPVLLGAAPAGRLAEPAGEVIAGFDAPLHRVPSEVPESSRFKGLVFDGSGISDSTDLRHLWEFFQPLMRRIEANGRVLVLGTPPEACETPREATAQGAIEGFVRALAKELRNSATGQLLYVAPGAERRAESTLRFFLSPRSAYVSGQVVRIADAVADVPELDWDRPFHGKVALVTGASRGIGESIAHTLARDGAHVAGLDIPALADDLEQVIGGIGGSSIAVDITEGSAPEKICDKLTAEHDGVDVVVHNAGITRDKKLANMDERRWTELLDVNLSSQERINDALLTRKALKPNARVVTVSSISGIAGNAGQTNYSTAKAGVIGMVRSMAPALAETGATINAVAPGFIETEMTASMPIAAREAGRRMNSLSQGGLPVDVAETIGWLASPASTAINGEVVRVCGQSLIGA